MKQLLPLAFLCTLAPAQFLGWVDQVAPDTISGWAVAPSSPAIGAGSRAAWVHFFDGNTYLGSVPSNNVDRPDVQAVHGLPSPWVGFSWTTPALAPGVHTIHAYVNNSVWASTGNPLPGATQLTVPRADFVGPRPFGVLESISSTRVTGWACDPDAAGAPVEIDVFAQMHGVGEPVLIATGSTSIFRGDIPCGSGFDFALPALPGGQHGLWARARNIGPGQDRLLERFTGIAATVTFPFSPSYNADPGLHYAPTCFEGPGGLVNANCPGWPVPTWTWSVFASGGLPPAQPVNGYQGAAARIRYEALAGGGMVTKINTFDYQQVPDVFPWDYNFQAIQTRMPQANMSGLTNPILEVDLTVRNEQDWYHFDPAQRAPSCDPIHPVSGCPNPWVHVIAAAVFEDRTNGNGRFLELVPFYRQATDLFAIGGPFHQQNARLSLGDPRVAPHVNTPSNMLVGERRVLRADLRAIAQAVWPNENVDQWAITGGYVGTEQYGRIKVALDIRRLSLQWGYVAGTAIPYGNGCPAGAEPQLVATTPPTIGAGLGVTITGTQGSLGASVLALGLSSTSWNGVPLPRDLGAAGLTGCAALTDVVAAFVASGVPSANVAVPLPWNPALLGSRFFGQAYVQRVGANPAGIVASRGMTFTIGG